MGLISEQMNKWQLICPGVALAIVLIVFLVFGAIHGRDHVRYYIMSVSRAIGTELIEKTNSNHVVKIDSGLHSELASLLGSPTQVSEVLLGDEPGKSDDKASSRLVLTNSVGKGLVIRLGPAEQSEGFQVLGYWSLSK